MKSGQGRGVVTVAVGALALGGCVTVKTPDKPIEINLNVTIRQEVVVRLQKDVDQLINQNPDAFGQKATPPAATSK
ncbi:YnbE family lipoprotein [Sphingomonas sp. ASV193]|uniref:YnbE family lipoprotein n=1 Tax=Sphingomonas sp. ASV193 TaxID=3144405 RepID=UPI0032E90807